MPQKIDTQEAITDVIEYYLEKPYWIIDILPRQVANDGEGQYFKVEAYYLNSPHLENIYHQFAQIIIRLSCYKDMDMGTAPSRWVHNPPPRDVERMIQDSLITHVPLFIIMPSADTMISISGEDTYMTIYNPNTDMLELLRALSASAGLFIWKPEERR